MMTFNNREIAFWFWLFAATMFVIWKTKPSLALLSLFRPLWSRPVRAVIALMLLYVLGCVQLLSRADLWTPSDLKTTLYWFCGFAVATLFDISRITEEDSFFAKSLRESASFTALLVFITGLVTFSLATELVFVFFVLALSLLSAVSEKNPTSAKATVLLNLLLALLGIAALLNSVYTIAEDSSAFATIDRVREFTTPILLTLLFIPFIVFLKLYTSFELAFVRIGISINDRKLARLARHASIRNFVLDLQGLRKWLRHIALFRPTSPEELSASISEIRNTRLREITPPVVPPMFGWPPSAALRFLDNQGLKCGDYHRTYDCWSASSTYLKLGTSVLDNSLVFYLEGMEVAVLKLILVLNVNSPSEGKTAEAAFSVVAGTLISKAVPGLKQQGILSIEMDGTKHLADGRTIRVTKEMWTGGIPGGYEVRLEIDGSQIHTAPTRD